MCVLIRIASLPFSIKKKEESLLVILNLPLWEFSKGFKNEFETAVVTEPSVFEPLKFYCILFVFITVTLINLDVPVFKCFR